MTLRTLLLAALVCGLSGAVLATAGCASARTFATPEDAMVAVADIAGKGDTKAIDEIFGPGATEVIYSGDSVADHEDGLRVGEMIRDRVEIIEGENEAIAFVGEDGWPFPIPLVRAGGGWQFDLAAGRDELLSRRIGRNELLTIDTLHALVDAQAEYRSIGRDGNPAAYAQKLWSTDGKQDGLYWPTREGEPESPIGPLVAEAAAAGYQRSQGVPQPFHGYYYRILDGQGPDAPGGRRSYLDPQGRMTGGFAAVAWPASYGNSGIMTFVVNEIGVVFQKDLGPGTDSVVDAITRFNPDDSWEPTAD